MTGPETDTIEVEGLGEPGPEPEGLPPEPELGDEPPEAPPDRAMQVESMTVGLMAPFAIVALRRGPHWRVTADEVRPIAEALAMVLPANALTDRLVRASPWASAGLQLYALIQVRLEADAAMQENPDGEPLPRPRIIPRPDAPGAAAGQAEPGLHREPGADGEDAGTRAHSGAGLGFGPPGIGPRPAGPGE